jgi:hypothetical protein
MADVSNLSDGSQQRRPIRFQPCSGAAGFHCRLEFFGKVFLQARVEQTIEGIAR